MQLHTNFPSLLPVTQQPRVHQQLLLYTHRQVTAVDVVLRERAQMATNNYLYPFGLVTGSKYLEIVDCLDTGSERLEIWLRYNYARCKKKHALYKRFVYNDCVLIRDHKRRNRLANNPVCYFDDSAKWMCRWGAQVVHSFVKAFISACVAECAGLVPPRHLCQGTSRNETRCCPVGLRNSLGPAVTG